MALYEILEYRDVVDRHPFKHWFDGLDPQAAAKVNIALTRLANGNTSNVKGVGGSVLEVRVDFGPGYRIYFRTGWARTCHSLGRRHQAPPTT
jgi:putative addiction module killer protein